MVLPDVHALAERVRILEQEVQILRNWRHEMVNELMPLQLQIRDARNEIMTAVSAIATASALKLKPHGNRVITMRDFWIAFGTVSVTAAIFKFLQLLRP